MTGLLELDDERTAAAGPERDPRRVVGAAVVASTVALVVVVGGSWAAWSLLTGDDESTSAQHSRSDLATPPGGAPIHVPASLPSGVAADGTGFAVTVEQRPSDVQDADSDPEWVSRYDVAFADGTDRVRVLEWVSPPESGTECGPTAAATPFLTWSDGSSHVVVCGDSLGEEGAAAEYWSEVEWTSDLTQVAWLRD